MLSWSTPKITFLTKVQTSLSSTMLSLRTLLPELIPSSTHSSLSMCQDSSVTWRRQSSSLMPQRVDWQASMMQFSFAKLHRLKSVFNLVSTTTASRFLTRSRETLRTCPTMIPKSTHILAVHLPLTTAERRITRTSIRAVCNIWHTHLPQSYRRLRRRTGQSSLVWPSFWERTSTTSWSFWTRRFCRA